MLAHHKTIFVNESEFLYEIDQDSFRRFNNTDVIVSAVDGTDKEL
jgi:hypothetical protein